MLKKIGATAKILRRASSIEELLLDKPIETLSPTTSIISPVLEDHLFYRARAISAGDQGPKDRPYNYNGNFDYFPRKELEASYNTFIGRNIFLDHNSSSSLYSVGKILDASPIEDPDTGEFYIEILGKIDRTLHPEICRKIETGELNSTSMGCSVDSSRCSICGHELKSDSDPKCEHLESFSLGKKFVAEVDFPEYNIKRGEMVPAFSINSGIVFNEDSIVGVPADSAAVIKSIIANMKNRLTKTSSLSQEEKLDLSSQMEKLFEKLDESTKISLKAEFCGICPPVKEPVMADKNSNINDEQKQILNKISAYEMEQLESYIQHKTKKASEVVNKEVVADATKKEETFLSKIVAKVKDSFAAQLLEKKIETVAKEEIEKEAKKCSVTNCRKSLTTKEEKEIGECKECQKTPWMKPEDYKKYLKEKKSSLLAKFNEDKNNVLASTWSVYNGDKLILDASLKDIWGSQFETLSFDDQKWATSEAYGTEVVARYQKEGLEKLADLWDVTYKLNKTAWKKVYVHPKDNKWHVLDANGKSYGEFDTKEEAHILWEKLEGGPEKAYTESSLKTASEPKLGPSGPRVKPNTGTSNKEHNVKNSPVTKPGQETAQKGPAAPAGKDVKTETKIDMPGQEQGQKGPAAPKAKEVKTDYSEPKPEAEGKEVTTTPKNPEEKKMEKSEKEVETSYVAKGTEEMKAEEKGKEKSEKKSYKEQNSIIKWSSMAPDAQEFIKKHVKKHIDEDGMDQAQAVRVAYEEARKKGMDVPSKKSSQETDMNKKAAEKPVESVDGSTLPEGKKEIGDKPEEAVEGTTLPEEGKSATPETSVDGEKVSKTPNLTVAPDEAVKDKPAEKGKDKNPDEAVKDKKEHTTSNPTSEPDMAVNKKASAPCKNCGKEMTQDNPEGDFCGSCLAEHLSKNKPVTAATEMPTPEMSTEEVKVEEKPAGTPEVDPMAPVVEGPKVEAPKAEVSAFDKVDDKLEIGDGYEAHKDKGTNEIIIMKDSKEVKRLPDGFGKDTAVVLSLLKAVLGLPPTSEEKAPEMAPSAPKMEEPKPEVVPALEEAHEDELAMKESALKAKEAELQKKEAALKAIELKAQEEEKAKKFASILKTRSERCQKIVTSMIDKKALSWDTDTYDTELLNGSTLLDARNKAFDVSINAKMKELLAQDDNTLNVIEKTISEIKAPVEKSSKTASWLKFSPEFTPELSDEAYLGKIFDSMGKPNQRPQ